jgi:hypothetical protein
MAVPAMPQLVEGQAARLDVGVSLPCRIIGFSGADVVLALQAAAPDALEAGTVGYLLVEASGSLQAVRGSITAPAGGELILRLTDRIRLGQRRLFSRAPIALPAELRQLDEVRAWKTVTRDVSAGGVRIARPDGAEVGEGRLELAIAVGDHEATARVEIVRQTARDLGLRFAEIDRDDRLLLASLALAYHRMT